ncbi:hypothetical protein ACHAWO_003564 [Cyclotella atomus]|uniref:BACK domain-containing protein n=1 Tax=Cyclotella atomus TaxID=382360 RepID=A0ABD3QR61_9STRA
MSDNDNNQDDLGMTDPESDDDEEEDFGFMDLDEADELFFNSMMRKDDSYVDTENADDLMQLLQEMVDSNRAAVIDDEEFAEMDEATLMEILGYDDTDDEDEEPASNDVTDRSAILNNVNESKQSSTRDAKYRGMRDLEHALMQGVVPADAGVGSGILPGDIGFDPLELSTKDYFKQVQTFILNMLPERKIRIDEDSSKREENNTGGAAMPIQGFVGEEERPPALILRDYREAEIRHGRLAMLAAAIWPLQEIIDRIFMPETFGDFTVIYGGQSLPFLPLLMTFMMLNLGYLDIYSSEIKENESGDAFLPGECFWDPLCMLEGAPDQMKRNMQEREILNGRAAMIAVAAFGFEEAMTHRPVISIGRNDLLFEPVYQVPFIQAWLDQQFGSVGETIMFQ